MEFHLDKDTKPELILEANNQDLQERWILRNPGYFMKNETGNSVAAFVKTKPRDKKLQRTRLAFCEDDCLERTVLAKTVCYDKRELNNEEAIKARRRAIYSQVDILNRVCSNMLPEPLDFFEITNTYDNFGHSISENIKNREPVLILDYIPGSVLADKLQNPRDKSFYRTDEVLSFHKSTEQINVGIIMRLIGDVLAFMMELYDKNYAYTSLTPDHIVLLGDNKPRFVGLGRICPIMNDRYDSKHVNFGRHIKGFSAPEFNQKETNFGINASVKAAIAYNIGVLIASMVLSKTEFEDKQLINGAYDYINSAEERNEIKRAMHGQWLDNLICRLTTVDPTKRLTDFEEIMKEFAIISGDAKRETTKEVLHYGKVKFFAYDKGYGFVTSQGVDYFVPLTKIENAPEGYDGQDVTFTVEKDRYGKDVVKAFVKPPKTKVEYPRTIKKAEPTVQFVKPVAQPVVKQAPMTKATPVGKQTATSEPQKKKGFLARLFGM